jgi:hypothetical protein
MIQINKRASLRNRHPGINSDTDDYLFDASDRRNLDGARRYDMYRLCEGRVKKRECKKVSWRTRFVCRTIQF